jgi:hypothetical protein
MSAALAAVALNPIAAATAMTEEVCLGMGSLS